jgi:hypothetical protein
MDPSLTDEQYQGAYGNLLSIIPDVYSAKARAESAGQNRKWEVEDQQTKQKMTEAVAQAKGYEAYQNAALASANADRANTGAWERATQSSATAPRMAQINRAADMENMASQFESMRQQILDNTAPRDWFVREKARLAVNPYAGLTQGSGGPSGDTPPMASTLNPRNSLWTGGVFPSDQVNVPENIKGFLSGAKNFGSAIETPSAQTWGVSPYATQQGLLGYSEALGQNPVDMATQMRNMLPNNPSRGTQWSVRRQR